MKWFSKDTNEKLKNDAFLIGEGVVAGAAVDIVYEPETGLYRFD